VSDPQAGLPVGNEYRGTAPSDRDIAGQYLASHRVRKLHLGSGQNVFDGWLNTDRDPTVPRVIRLDAVEPLPFSDMTFDYVFTEHMISALTFDEGLACLRECCRVLRPAGRIRIATPDLARIAGLCGPEKNAAQQRYIEWAMSKFFPQTGAPLAALVVNNFFYSWGHRFIYDRESLTYSLESSGFRNIEERRVGESPDPELAGIERHGQWVIGDEQNLFETFVLEGLRAP
jgi:predicted SAM-dependent methyltransferase